MGRTWRGLARPWEEVQDICLGFHRPHSCVLSLSLRLAKAHQSILFHVTERSDSWHGPVTRKHLTLRNVECPHPVDFHACLKDTHSYRSLKCSVNRASGMRRRGTNCTTNSLRYVFYHRIEFGHALAYCYEGISCDLHPMRNVDT